MSLVDVSTRVGAAVCALLVATACTAAVRSGDDGAAIYDAWRDGRSRVEVTASGSVVRLLGTRIGRSGAHEGFLVHLSGAGARGLTVRVEDNVDLTGPIPLAPGDAVTVRGEYIYDPRGGLIHYTHRDPRGRHPDGFVRVRDRVYR